MTVNDDLFRGKGRPALMSPKEPAIMLLKNRYSESFALTGGARQGQAHLFLIKYGMWALVWTFFVKDSTDGNSGEPDQVKVLNGALREIEMALSDQNERVRNKIDLAVKRAKMRIEARSEELIPKKKIGQSA